VIAAAASGLSGCWFGAPRTTYHVDAPYNFLADAASRGIIPVMVVGEPYPGRRDQVEAALVTAFDRNFKSLNNPFRAMPPTAGPGTKIVVIFNAVGTPAARKVCEDPTQIATEPAKGRTSVAAVYCGDGPYSEYWLSFPTPQSPEDPKFPDMMNRLAYFTVPREANPERG
jgi:hypothetical protein